MKVILKVVNALFTTGNLANFKKLKLHYTHISP